MAERFEAKAEALVPAPIERVWDALATSEGFGKIYEGITVESDWKVAGPVVWSGLWEGKAFRDEGVIVTYDKPTLFVYTYWTSFWGVERTPDTTQTIRNEFQAVAGGTRVTITQSNIPTAESRDHSQGNWKGILDRLAVSLK
jgi:uncharacterized protein YndB with AHSA1/START domain